MKDEQIVRNAQVSKLLLLGLLFLILLSITVTYNRYLVEKDFIIIDDLDEEIES